MMKSLRILSVLMMVFAFTAASSQASILWNGSVDTDFSNGDNWDGGVRPGDGDVALFAGTPTANQPDLLGGSVGVSTLQFDSAGWTLSASTGNSITFRTIDAIISSGAGVNVIDAAFLDQYVQDMTIVANADNTLVLKQDFTMRRDYKTGGEGMVVFEGIGSSRQTWTLGPGMTLFNIAVAQPFDSGSSVAAGGTIGGTTPTLSISQYGTLALADGAHLSPGGDGVYGDLIHTLRVQSATSGSTRAYLDMGGSSSSLIMDIGSSLGENDMIIVDLKASNGYFYLRDSELALRGSGALADGDYTILTEESGNYSGQFGKVTYNGQVVDEANFSLSYNDDSIVLTVSDVPEPASMSLLALCALAMIRRR